MAASEVDDATLYPMLLNTNDRRPVHFVGVGGAGMSALAELFVQRGVLISGCDATDAGLGDLARLNVQLNVGHDPSHVAGCRALVVTSAMPAEHPELRAAREQGIPVIRRAEALGEAVNSGVVVALAGTHGKTTTTVMTTEALVSAGRDPTGIVGGRVGSWNGNLKMGSTDLAVVEADEYDRSFLALRPTIAVVTNVEADHLDIYKDLADIRATFEKFISPASTVVLCEDDEGAASLHVPSGADVVRYALQEGTARVVGVPRVLPDRRTELRISFDGEPIGELLLNVPGDHNARNALAAVSAGLSLGATLAEMTAGLERFRGVERRFQHLGRGGGVDVVDDYAHHPTELRATIAAARTAFPGRRLIVAFQPHLFTRTRDFAPAFAEALTAADAVFLAAIYPAREAPIAGVSSSLIASAMQSSGHDPVWQGPRGESAAALAAYVVSGDVVLTVGAGDITRTGPELLTMLINERG